MNVDRAISMTFELACASTEHWSPLAEEGVPELSFMHLFQMNDKCRGAIEDPEHWNMSYGKKCRWLGWMQAAVVQALYPRVTMQTMREINAACSDGEELVTIRKTEFDSILRDKILLEALQAGGVTNWEWYDASLEDHLQKGFYDD